MIEHDRLKHVSTQAFLIDGNQALVLVWVLGLLRPVAEQVDQIRMTTEPPKCVILIYLHVIDPSINTVDSLEYQRDALQPRYSRSAFEHLSLNDR